MSSVDWINSKARKLLEREIKNREIPFDAKKMGAKAVYEKYKSCPEFQGMPYDATFQRRLRSLRKIVKEKEEDDGVDWDNSAAKVFLKDAFEDGIIPMNYKEIAKAANKSAAKAAEEVWHEHCAGHPSFEGMVFNSIFQRRLESAALNHNSKKSRAAADLKAFEQYREKYPIRSHNDIGLPRWEGSDAEEKMKKDITDGKHAGLKPHQFRLTRPVVFGAWPLPIFRNHLYQELKLRKFHNQYGVAADKQITS